MTTHGYLSLTPPLALAVMEGRKAQTMRPITDPALSIVDVVRWQHVHARDWRAFDAHHVPIFRDFRAPYAPGDVLWVREPAVYLGHGATGHHVRYVADDAIRRVEWPARLRPLPVGRRIPNGCHREAARTFVRVLSVEPRRVQDITEEEARAEGLDPVPVHGRWAGPREEGGHWSARKPFAELWDSLYRARGLGWDANPWCWMVRFERVEVDCA